MTKKRIFYLLLLFLFITAITRVQSVKADPAQSLDLDYNINTQTLNVTIGHAVSNNNTHYIDSVVVKFNGSTVLTQPYTSQPTLSFFSYQYVIAASNDTKIEVIITCNQGGDLSNCIVVGGGTCEQGNGGDIPGYIGLIVISGVSVVIFLTIIHKKVIKK